MATVENRRPHVLQAFFLRAGSLVEPLELNVERTRDGGRFAHRRVQLRQANRLLLTAEASFYSGTTGPEHQRPLREGLAQPETLTEMTQLANRDGKISAAVRERMRMRRSILVKPIDAEAGLTRRASEPRLALWMKPAHRIPPDAALHYAALAYMSDHWLAGSCQCIHAESIFEESDRVISLHHGMWFHRPTEVNEWQLYELESPVAHDGLGLNRGLVYERSGNIVASTVQQALMSA